MAAASFDRTTGRVIWRQTGTYMTGHWPPDPGGVEREMTADQLPRTMQAVICHGPGDYRLEEYPVPTPGVGEVVIRVQSVGICASDLKNSKK